MAPWFTLSQSVKCRNRGIENTAWPPSLCPDDMQSLFTHSPRVSGRCSWTTRTRSEPRCRSPKRLWEKLRACLSRAALEHYQEGPPAQVTDPPRPRILRAHTLASVPAGVSPWPRPWPRLILGPTLLCPDKRIIIILLQPTTVLHNLRVLQPATVRCLQPDSPEPVFHPCPRHRPRLQDPGPKSTRRSWKDHSGSYRKQLSKQLGDDRHFSSEIAEMFWTI